MGASMLAAIKHGLGNLTNFNGRDARQAFWYYVLFVYLVTIVIGLVASIPMTMQAMMIGVEQGMAHAGDPEAARVAMQQATLANFDTFLPALFWTGAISAAILLLGLAAAIVRRLHDSGLSGYWALLPGALQVFNLVSMPSQIEQSRAMMAAQFADPSAGMGMFASAASAAVLGWAAIVLVIVFGVRKSTPGPNRFGEAPFVA